MTSTLQSIIKEREEAFDEKFPNEISPDGSSYFNLKKAIHPSPNALKSFNRTTIHKILEGMREMWNVDEIAERVVIEYSNRNISGRDDNRTEVREAVRKVFTYLSSQIAEVLDNMK